MLSFLLPGSLQAATLTDIYLQTLHHQPDLQKAVAEREAAQQVLRQAEAGYYPRVDIHHANGPEYADNPATQALDGGSTRLWRLENRLTAEQNLFTGGRVKNQVRAQLSALASSDDNVRATREQIALDTTTAYLNLLRYRRLITIAQANIQAHLNTLNKVHIRERAGAGRRVDTALSRSRLALAQTQLINMKALYDSTLANFIATTGQPAPAQLSYPNFLPKVPFFYSLNPAIDYAVAHNPVITAAHHEANKALATVGIAKANFWPQVKLQFNAHYNENTDGVRGKDEAVNGLLVVDYNLFSGGANTAIVAEARAKLRVAIAELYSMQRKIIAQLTIDWTNYAANRVKVMRLRQYVRNARLVVQDYLIQFTIGKRPLFNVLDAENEAFNAERELTNAEFDTTINLSRVLADLQLLHRTLLQTVNIHDEPVAIVELLPKLHCCAYKRSLH